MRVEIFGKGDCINCQKAISVAKNYRHNWEYKNITYTKYFDELKLYIGDNLTADIEIPIIFINNKHVGNYTNYLQYIEDHVGGFGDSPI
jgi:glutaredoxin